MKKIRFDDCICKDKLVDHGKIREQILWHIDKSADRSSLDKQTNITKVDWDKASDFERPWVKLFLPKFSSVVKEMIYSMGYRSLKIKECWYQQYNEGSCHSWHIHSDHFTGVYYLEYPKGSSKTEICSPFSLKIKKIDVKEGDIIIFPSHWIHRSGVNTSSRKTIISYNFSIHTAPWGKEINVDLIKGGKPYIFF